MDRPPHQIYLRTHDAAVELRPDVGGRVAQITIGDRQLLRGESDRAGAGWAYWGAYPLAPWSNRIPGGRFMFQGHEFTVPVNWSDGSAIHGLVAREPWSVRTASHHRVEMQIDVVEGPFELSCEQVLELSPGMLTVTLSARNRADHPVPAGLGIHPWLNASSLRIPATQIWPTVNAVPTGEPRAVRAGEDLRSGMLPPVLDACFTGLTDSKALVGDVTLEWSAPVDHLVVYTGEPGWVCVEPVTHANNGFNLMADGVPGHGVEVLEPGGALSATFGFRWGRLSM